MESLVKHLRADTEAAARTRIALMRNQHVAGIGSPILEEVDVPLPHLEAETVFFPKFRQFLKTIGAKLFVTNPGVKPLQREQDSCIMDAVIASDLFSTNQLSRTNCMRL